MDSAALTAARCAPDIDLHRGASIAIAVCVALLGCAGERGASEAWNGTVDTLSGGGVRVVSPRQGLWTDETAWRLEEDLRIGSLDSEGPDLFGEIVDLAVDPAGRIYVLEEQAQELRVFGPDGTYVRTIGRQGQGPGEFNILVGGQVFVDASGRIWINNSFNRRWDVFSLEGELLASTPMTGGFSLAQGVMGSDGFLYEKNVVMTPDGSGSRPIAIRNRMQEDGLVPLDTADAPTLPEVERIQVSLENEGRNLRLEIPVPLVHQPSWEIDPGGYLWLEPGDGYRLVALTFELDTLRVVERVYDPVPVSEADVEKALEGFSTGPFASGGIKVERSRIPEHHPALDVFRTDPEGNLWVRRTLGDGRWAWEVFDPEGRFLGPIVTAADLDALTVHLITSDAVYGVLRDELDVPYVVRLRIMRGA